MSLSSSTASSVMTLPQAISYDEFTKYFNLDYKIHQEECVDWCFSNEEEYSHGGLIADEMGLGKTIQMLSLFNRNPKPNTLIVVPVALIEQWEKVLKDLTMKNINIIIYRGNSRKKINKEQLSKSICLTTYGEISRTKEKISKMKKPNELQQNDFASLIHQIQWCRIVFDEAHHLRNNKTIISNAALFLESRIKWLLTGTPIQNRISDFHTLCNIINIPQDLYKGSKMDLKKLTRDYIIKRTKKGLNIPMPKLTEHMINVPWNNPKEAEIARMLHRSIRVKLLTTTEIGNVENPFASDFRLLDYIRARQICVFPKLLAPIVKQYQEKEEVDLLTKGIEGCSKLNAVLNKIKENNKKNNTKKNRSLVFCEFHQEMDFLEQALSKENIKTARIDGKTKKEEKKRIINSEDIEVMILQVKTCSEGLNLQQYNNVYIVTPQWNPCVELQAICRCYRIGQMNDVNVYRFNMEINEEYGLSTKTIETYINSVQKEKTKISEKI
jgi:SNF2 family DNA or RNA helicase